MRSEKGELGKAEEEYPQLHAKKCDISKEAERKRLHDWILSNFPRTNVLINNAGIQTMVDMKRGTQDLLSPLESIGDEIDTNFKALVYMSAHFTPDFMRRKEAAIVNVSSGLGFIPMAIMPVYCATKAAVHSFSVSMRYQLKDTPIKVFEIIPPMVDTDLDRGGRDRRGQAPRGMPPREVAEAAVKGLERDEFEIAVGQAQNLCKGARTNFDQVFCGINC